MLAYILKRTLHYFVLWFVAVTFVYLLAGTQLEPRDVFAQQLLTDARPEQVESIERFLADANLDTSESVFVRYGRWLKDVVTRNEWGVSPRGGPVSEEIGRRIWVSLRLVTIGVLTGAIGGTIAGAWTATRQYTRSDKAITLSSLLIISIPTYVIAALLQIGATEVNQAVGSQFFVFVGETSGDELPFWQSLIERLRYLILPTFTLAISAFAFYSRIQRSLMLDNLASDYVRTAQAKGLTRGRAVFKHALRTSLIPTATYFAFTVGALFVGSTFVERIFSWHGMGIYTVETLVGNDIHGAVAAAAFAGFLVIISAILSDFFVAVLDPRVRVN